MKQKKQKDITLELIYKELTGFITKQEEFNAEVKNFMVKQEEFNTEIKKDIQAIKSCPTIKREIELL